MDPREMEALVQRLVHNPHDQDAISRAYEAGQQDPRSYAMLLEKVGTATGDPVFASHWLTEAANVWSTTMGDAHRAARALMIAVDRDPTQPTPAERLSELYREKGDVKALVALLERRGKALGAMVHDNPDLRLQLSGIHEELGRLWAEPPLTQAKKAIENYQRAVELDPANQYAIYALRELYKAAGRWAEAVPYFELEQRLTVDSERQLALYQDEAEVRKSAGDWPGALTALRRARQTEGGQDAALKQQLASLVLEGGQSGARFAPSDQAEAAQLFVELSEEYPGEHGYSYAMCALELAPSHDRAIQLAMYYGGQLGREPDVAPRAAAYLKSNPSGALAAEARELISRAMEGGAFDESMLEALAPAPGAPASERVRGLLEVAGTLAKKGRKNDAAQHYREVLALEPANEEALGFLEPHLRQGRKYGELRDVLLAAARSSGGDEEQRASWLRDAAGLSEAQLRDVEGAIAAWKELIELDPDDEESRAHLRRLLERGNRWDELTALLQREADTTEDVEARISLEKSVAKIHEQKRKDPIATGEAWARIARLSPDDDNAIQTALRQFERGERPDLAAAVIADNVGSITDARSKAQLYKRLGELREGLGDMAAAAEAYADGAGVGRDVALWQAAERCFVQIGNWEQAASALSERAALTSGDAERAALIALEAEYLGKSGDRTGAILRLEQASELDPRQDAYSEGLEQRYQEDERTGDLVSHLLRRADKLGDKTKRVALRKRAAGLQRDVLADADEARETLELVLLDGDDTETLSLLAEDAEKRGEFSDAVEFLVRLEKLTDESAARAAVVRRQARLLADGQDDAQAAIEKYELILRELDAKDEEALAAIAALQTKRGDARGAADALERQLAISADRARRLDVAERLADLYEGELDQPDKALRALDIVRELEPEDFGALERACELAERLELWPRVAEHLAALIEIEGDDAEVSRMTRRLAEILHGKLGRNDDALAALVAVADEGDEGCREDYVALADQLGWKGIVAAKLVEWNEGAPAGAKRNADLRGAFDRFLEVGRKAEAASVAKELARTKAADAELAQSLEAIAIELRDLDALSVAHDLIVSDRSGAERAEEMVRQAEVLVQAGVDAATAVQHGEQALTSISPDQVEPLLARLARLAPAPGAVIDLYERQVMRCKGSPERLRALTRAAQVAAEQGDYERARGFFDIALSGAAHEEVWASLEEAALAADAKSSSEQLRRTLAEAMSAGGQGARDGGRTRAALLRRAALLVHRELGDVEQAFRWLGDAIVAHVDDDGLGALTELAERIGDPRRAEAVLTRALDEVFDGPLVRKLLLARAALRRDRLEDKAGAAADLRRLHDLSPADAGVTDQLSALYTELRDYRGMVALFEDQILRGKQPDSRLELARKVARLWDEQLDDPREAADAWRRVLRMKAGDAEATAGLERAKANMLKHRASDPDAGVSGPVPELTKPAPKAEVSEATDEPGEATSAEQSLEAAPAPAALDGAEGAPEGSRSEDAAAESGTAADTPAIDDSPAAASSAASEEGTAVATAPEEPKSSGQAAAGDTSLEGATAAEATDSAPAARKDDLADAAPADAAPADAAPDDVAPADAAPADVAPADAAPAESSPTPEPAESAAPAEQRPSTPSRAPTPPSGLSRPPPPPPPAARSSSATSRPVPPPPPGKLPAGTGRPPPPPPARGSGGPPPPPPRTQPPAPPARPSAPPPLNRPSRSSLPPPLPGASRSVPPPLPVAAPGAVAKSDEDEDIVVDDSELLAGED